DTEPSNIKNHVRRNVPGGELVKNAAPPIAPAVAPTFTVTGCAALPSCNDELDGLQVGAAAPVGATAQLKFTVPVNDPVGATTKLKVAVCPALMVWEVGDPEAAVSVKSVATAAVV